MHAASINRNAALATAGRFSLNLRHALWRGVNPVETGESLITYPRVEPGAGCIGDQIKRQQKRCVKHYKAGDHGIIHAYFVWSQA